MTFDRASSPSVETAHAVSTHRVAWQKRVVAFAALACGAALVAPGCSSDTAPDPFTSGGTSGTSGTSGASGSSGGVCIRNNCKIDDHCRDCAGNAKTCDKATKRCIACKPGGAECGEGKSCNQAGQCISQSAQCAVDGSGLPTITCAKDDDCAACPVGFNVCNTTTGKCGECSEKNKDSCQTTETCVKGSCAANCPEECQSDNDCERCNSAGKKAPVCNRGKCGVCNETKGCPEGSKCDDRGLCVKDCGISAGNRAGATKFCRKDADCSACESTKKCKLPLNGGLGECAVDAPGCSDLGKGLITLPSPFDKVTNTCSNDTDCKDVSVDFNVGKALKDITGIGGIGDATIKYGMNACASVKVTGVGGTDLKCGVCVPCRQDSDCKDINVLEVAGQAFGPLGSIAAAVLLDQIFGPNDAKLHLYCQKLGADFGACVPCANVLASCGQTTGAGGNNMCNHDVCKEGTPLPNQASCQDGCAAEVCKDDPYCCNTKWDFLCTLKVPEFCTKKTCQTRSCAGKAEGWYCDETPGSEGKTYECKGENPSAAPNVCLSGKKCERTDPNDIRKPSKTIGGKPTCMQ
jgi:hypothetical protein